MVLKNLRNNSSLDKVQHQAFTVMTQMTNSTNSSLDKVQRPKIKKVGIYGFNWVKNSNNSSLDKVQQLYLLAISYILL